MSFDDRGHVFEDDALCDDAADEIERLQARVAELQAELEAARQDAMEDVLQSVGEMLAGTLEVDVSPVARKKIRAAIIRAFASRPDAMPAARKGGAE